MRVKHHDWAQVPHEWLPLLHGRRRADLLSTRRSG